jgi:hypothetical protein
MPNPTDQYYIIAEFLHNSNRYAPSTRPYLYGELSSLPKHILENRNFIVPVNEATITSELIKDNTVELTVNNNETKLLQERVTIQIKEVEEPKLIEEVVNKVEIEKSESNEEKIEVSEVEVSEVEIVKPKLSRKPKKI